MKSELLRFEDVNKSFNGRQILKNISFSLNENESLAILGPSGTGKSVLLKLAVALFSPDSGKIYFRNRPYSEMTELEKTNIRQKIGLIFQLPALIENWTAFENVSFALKILKGLNLEQCEDTIYPLFEKFKIKDIEKKYPHEISVGAKKKLSIARSMVLQPEALLFDEPTTSLDPQSTSAINEAMLDLKKNFRISSIVVSHDMKSALDLADRIIVLEKGAIVDSGTPKEILNSQYPLTSQFLKEGLWHPSF